jgi:lipoprotein-anchoring transpeptidase ErfK/SrfK
VCPSLTLQMILLQNPDHSQRGLPNLPNSGLLTSLLLTGILDAMTHSNKSISRRDFLKAAGISLGALVIPSRAWNRFEFQPVSSLPEFPPSEIIGRNCSADTNLSGGKIEMKVRPDVNSGTIRDVYRDEVFAWIKEVSAESISYDVPSQRWVETPEGYLRSRYIQPCRNLPNIPLTALPQGQAGFWGEVTVPYVDLINYYDATPTRKGWLFDLASYNLQPRLYYQQVTWIDEIKPGNSGTILYRVNERYGNPGDLFWADGAAFRPLTEEDISPISPDVDANTKKIVVNLVYQTLSCFEGDREVYFCRVSTGQEEGSTPYGEHPIWRKMISTRMAANTVASYELPAIPWTVLFVGTGVAIHGATSHNDFGWPRSHGCVNCRPEDAKWIFRWTMPEVALEPGLIDWSDWRVGSTHVFVEDTI